MRILLSNDDGVHAPGIQTLAKALREFADVLLCKWEPRPIASILA